MQNPSRKRNAVICIRVPQEIKQQLEELAQRFDEYPSAIGRKCLNCFIKKEATCLVRKRYESLE